MSNPIESVTFVADPHIANFLQWGGKIERGLNQRCRDSLQTLRNAVVVANQHKGALAILGDLYHTTNPEPQIEAEVQRILHSADDVYTLKGNHDSVSSDRGDHALGPLAPVARIIETPGVGRIPGVCDLWCVPYKPNRPETWLAGAMQEIASTVKDHPYPRVLIVHMGIYDENTEPFLRAAEDAVPVEVLTQLCFQHKIRYVFAGNWHWPQKWNYVLGNDEVEIFQVGTLAPSRFTDDGLDFGRAVTLRTGSEIQITQISGPRFLRLTNLADLRSRIPAFAGNTVYVQLEVAPQDLDETRQFLANLETQGRIRGWRALADRKAAQATAKQAASSARSAKTLEKKVTGYVNMMRIDSDVDRNEVSRLSVNLLKGDSV